MYMSTPGREISCCLPFEQHNKKGCRNLNLLESCMGWAKTSGQISFNTQQILKVRESRMDFYNGALCFLHYFLLVILSQKKMYVS